MVSFLTHRLLRDGLLLRSGSNKSPRKVQCVEDLVTDGTLGDNWMIKAETSWMKPSIDKTII